MQYMLILLLLIPLASCSSEDRKAVTDKEAQKQVDRINDPINKAKEAAQLLEQHNQQQL